MLVKIYSLNLGFQFGTTIFQRRVKFPKLCFPRRICVWIYTYMVFFFLQQKHLQQYLLNTGPISPSKCSAIWRAAILSLSASAPLSHMQTCVHIPYFRAGPFEFSALTWGILFSVWQTELLLHAGRYINWVCFFKKPKEKYANKTTKWRFLKFPSV